MKARCFWPGFIAPDVMNMGDTMVWLNRTCGDYNELVAITTQVPHKETKIAKFRTAVPDNGVASTKSNMPRSYYGPWGLISPILGQNGAFRVSQNSNARLGLNPTGLSPNSCTFVPAWLCGL